MIPKAACDLLSQFEELSGDFIFTGQNVLIIHVAEQLN